MMSDLEMNVGPVTFKTNAAGTEVTVSAPPDVVAFCAGLWEHYTKELGDTDDAALAEVVHLEPSEIRHYRRDQLMNQMGRMIAMIAESDDDDD